jgi:hypothetical protein
LETALCGQEGRGNEQPGFRAQLRREKVVTDPKAAGSEYKKKKKKKN